MMQETKLTTPDNSHGEDGQAWSPQTREEIRASFWRSGLLSVTGLALFVIIVGLVPQPRLDDIPLLLMGIILALVPAAIWLAFFYYQDRSEPEPKRIVIRVFLFGALVASGAGMPIVDDLFRVGEWLHGGAWFRLLGLILVVGCTQEFMKFAAIRYTVFPTTDFHGRIDGIIYGVAAGLGYATALNLEYVLSHQGVILFVGSLRMVDTALAQAAFGAITGYFLAGAKHGDRPIWWVPAGLTTAAILNGLTSFLREEVSVQGFTYRPLNALLLAAAFVVVTLGILFAIIYRAQWRTATES